MICEYLRTKCLKSNQYHKFIKEKLFKKPALIFFNVVMDLLNKGILGINVLYIMDIIHCLMKCHIA